MKSTTNDWKQKQIQALIAQHGIGFSLPPPPFPPPSFPPPQLVQPPPPLLLPPPVRSTDATIEGRRRRLSGEASALPTPQLKSGVDASTNKVEDAVLGLFSNTSFLSDLKMTMIGSNQEKRKHVETLQEFVNSKRPKPTSAQTAAAVCTSIFSGVHAVQLQQPQQQPQQQPKQSCPFLQQSQGGPDDNIDAPGPVIFEPTPNLPGFVFQAPTVADTPSAERNVSNNSETSKLPILVETDFESSRNVCKDVTGLESGEEEEDE